MAPAQTTEGELTAQEMVHQDYLDEQVPLSHRRSPVTMGLLWITMVTGFPSVLVGFEWFKQGFVLSQILICLLVSNLILLAYALPACYLGAHSGQT
ncbi:MAG TPA: hypothetical protein V6C72_18495, partial [Chroococcales cyanobacterium]